MAANASAARETVQAAEAVAQVDAKPSAEDIPGNPLDDYDFPLPAFAKARTGHDGKQRPQLIAHRGHRAKYPENTLLAFTKAVKAGATAIETDVRLTKDKVIVLSHEKDLKLFGGQKKIVESTWSEIKDLKILAPPHLPMPRLQDLLQHLLQPEMQEAWLLLDMKSDEDPEPLMRLTASTIASVPAPWNQRIVLGLWAAKQLALAAKYLPGFPVVNIGFSLTYTKRHFNDPNIGCVMLIQTLLAPGGRSYASSCQKKGAPLIAWQMGNALDDRDIAHWCVRRRLDGIITDDPASMKKVLEEFDEQAWEPWFPIGLWAYWNLIKIYVAVNYRFWWFVMMLKLDDPVPRPKRRVEGKKDR